MKRSFTNKKLLLPKKLSLKEPLQMAETRVKVKMMVPLLYRAARLKTSHRMIGGYMAALVTLPA